MASSWGASWLSSWGVSWGGGVVPPTPTEDTAGPAGSKRNKRRRYFIGEREYLLNDAELHAELARLLTKPSRKERRKLIEPAKVVKLRENEKPPEPTYRAVPLFDLLWSMPWVVEQPQLRVALRQVASYLDDEADVEMLLLHD